MGERFLNYSRQIRACFLWSWSFDAKIYWIVCRSNCTICMYQKSQNTGKYCLTFAWMAIGTWAGSPILNRLFWLFCLFWTHRAFLKSQNGFRPPHPTPCVAYVWRDKTLKMPVVWLLNKYTSVRRSCERTNITAFEKLEKVKNTSGYATK